MTHSFLLCFYSWDGRKRVMAATKLRTFETALKANGIGEEG
jgi:hypothetical protein